MEGETAGFCVMCGKQGVQLYGPLCGECMSHRTTPATIPERISLTICPICGARQRGKHWETGPPPGFFHGKDLDPHVTVSPQFKLKEITWEESGQNPAIRVFTGDAVVELGGATTHVELKTEMKVISHTCPSCSRKGGSYYTAKIQLRQADDPRTARSADEFKETVGWLWQDFLTESKKVWRESIAWDEELREGVDVYLVDTTVAKAMAKALKLRTGATTKESASLWGVKDGRKTYRTTILLRFPNVLPGDFFETKGRLWQVDRLEQGAARFVDVVNGYQESRSLNLPLEGSRFLGGINRLIEVEIDDTDKDVVINPATGDRLRLVKSDETPARESRYLFVVLDGEKAWLAPKAKGRKRRVSE